MKKTGLAPALMFLTSVFSVQAASGALPDDAVGQSGGWRDVARPLIYSLKNLATEFSRSVQEEARRIKLKADAQALLLASAQRPIVGILDGVHSSGIGQSFLNNPALIAGWKAQGKTKIFFELRPEKQPILDRFYAGETTKGAFRQEIAKVGINAWLKSPLREKVEGDFVEGVALLKAAGIRAYCADLPFYERLNPIEQLAIEMSVLIAQANLSKSDARQILDHMFPGGATAFNGTIDNVLKKREAQNGDVAAGIKRHLHKGEGAIVVFGAGHFTEKRDLDEFLGGNKAVVSVAIFSNRDRWDQYNELAKHEKMQDPEDYVLISGDTFYQNKGGKGLETPGPMFAPSLAR